MPTTAQQTADTAAAPGARWEFRPEEAAGPRLVLAGHWDAAATGEAWHQIEVALRATPPARLDVEASGVEYCDGSGLALLQALRLGALVPGIEVTLSGLRPEFLRIYERFSVADYEANRPHPRRHRPVPEEIGRAVDAELRCLREDVEFLGSLAHGFFGNLASRKRMRWHEVVRVFELAGVNGLPIVSLISLLVGLIIAFESAQPLAMFGAQIFIANMIGLVMVRELGPLMTAILLAGRSSSAFAAELGTMKVNEELNALQTLGLDPVRFLVVQRVLAGVLLAPLLTAYSMAMGVLGGVIVMWAMGFPLELIYSQLASSLTVNDILVGLAKATAFGFIIASVGCLRGLQTQRGPSAVGLATTRAVVSSILLIIIADALFSLLLFVLEL